MRIASLLASGTEIVCALGLEDQLVAISHECDHPASIASKPRVSRPGFEAAGRTSEEIDAAVREARERDGAVYHLDIDALRCLAPDLILAQAVCEVCAVPTSLAREAAAGLGGAATVLSLDAHTVADIMESIRRVGEAAGVPDRAAALVALLARRVAAVEERVRDAVRPSVLALDWIAPPFLPGHWTPEMIELAGGRVLGAKAHRPSRQVSWEALASHDPDVLLLMPCGYDLAAARHDADRHAERLRAVAERAIGGGRAWVLNGSAYFNRSGPRTVDGIEILGAILHPERCSGYDMSVGAARWQP